VQIRVIWPTPNTPSLLLSEHIKPLSHISDVCPIVLEAHDDIHAQAHVRLLEAEAWALMSTQIFWNARAGVSALLGQLNTGVPRDERSRGCYCSNSSGTSYQARVIGRLMTGILHSMGLIDCDLARSVAGKGDVLGTRQHRT
jgi:hypothetical protein